MKLILKNVVSPPPPTLSSYEPIHFSEKEINPTGFLPVWCLLLSKPNPCVFLFSAGG